MEAAADWKEAAATGRVVPSGRGADAAYDAACDAADAAEAALADYLAEVRAALKCREVAFVSQNKESHVLEVPEAAAARAASSFLLVRRSLSAARFGPLKALGQSLRVLLLCCRQRDHQDPPPQTPTR